MAYYNTYEELLADARHNGLRYSPPSAQYHAVRAHSESPMGFVAELGSDALNVLCFQSDGATLVSYEHAVAIADYWNSLPTGAPVKDRSI